MTWNDEPLAHVTARHAARDERRRRYNTERPVTAAAGDGQPPLTGHPTVRFSGRPFQPELAWTRFEWKRVDAFLAHQRWLRYVGEQGQLGVGATPDDRGRKHAFQTLTGRFQPLPPVFRFDSAAGTPLAEMPARERDHADLLGDAPLTEGRPLIFQFPLPRAGV